MRNSKSKQSVLVVPEEFTKEDLVSVLQKLIKANVVPKTVVDTLIKEISSRTHLEAIQASTVETSVSSVQKKPSIEATTESPTQACPFGTVAKTGG